MYQTYKPSGKVSLLYIPLLLLFLFLFIPSVSFIYTYILWLSPSIVLNIILYIPAVFLLALFGCRVCIRWGKVRNLMLAGLSGLVAGTAFFYMMFACYYLFTTGDSSPGRLPGLLLMPGRLIEAWQGMIKKGFPVTTVKGLHLFTVKGGFFIAAAVILLLLTVLVLIIVYVDAAWFPFCEASKKWARDKTIYLEYIEDKDTFIKKLAFGDTTLLKQLNVLRGINCSHSEARLYITDQNSDFYITIENKKKKEGETEKDGTATFEEEEIADLLKLDHQTGEIMLARAARSPEQASAKVITEESGKNKIFSFFRMILAAGIQLGLLVFCFINKDSMKDFFSNGLVWYYMLISLFIYTLNFIGCFVKEDVMIKDEEQLYFNETRREQVKRWDSPLGHKIYYSIMLLSTIFILALCLRGNM